MKKLPKTIAVTEREGGEWLLFEEFKGGKIGNVHSIKFENGLIWDCVNGWRVTKLEYPRMGVA